MFPFVHLTTESDTTSGGHPYLLAPGTSRNEIAAITMPTPVARREPIGNNQNWIGGLLYHGRRGVWLFRV